MVKAMTVVAVTVVAVTVSAMMVEARTVVANRSHFQEVCDMLYVSENTLGE